MDPNILLDSFPDDMDMWNFNGNLFTDESINSSIKDQIKEENAGKIISVHLSLRFLSLKIQIHNTMI